MNFLQLCQRLRREAGVSGSGPAAVTGTQTNEYQRLIDWIADADVEIQAKYDDWRFMWRECSFNTTASDGSYTEAEITGSASIKIARLKEDSFTYYLTSLGAANEQPMGYFEYDDFTAMWRFGNTRTATGQPGDFTFSPDRKLLLGPLPNDIYTIAGEFYRAPVRMAADGDEPLYPSEFHMLPVWWALLKYAGFEEASFVYTNAQNQLNLLWGAMERRERPQVRFADTLA